MIIRARRLLRSMESTNGAWSWAATPIPPPASTTVFSPRSSAAPPLVYCCWRHPPRRRKRRLSARWLLSRLIKAGFRDDVVPESGQLRTLARLGVGTRLQENSRERERLALLRPLYHLVIVDWRAKKTESAPESRLFAPWNQQPRPSPNSNRLC